MGHSGPGGPALWSLPFPREQKLAELGPSLLLAHWSSSRSSALISGLCSKSMFILKCLAWWGMSGRCKTWSSATL